MKSSSYSLIDHIKLLLDSNEWYLEKIRTKNTLPFQEEIFCMAVISNAWSALEGYINFIASLAKFARKLESHEMAFLEEMDWKLNDKGKFEKQTAYQSTTKKFLFLLERFSSVKIVKFNKSRIWNDMKVSEKIRNGLIHPKETIVFKDFNLETAEMTHKTAKLAILFLEKKVLKSKHSSFQS